MASTGRNRIISQGERVNFGEFKTDGSAGYNPEHTHKRVSSATEDLVVQKTRSVPQSRVGGQQRAISATTRKPPMNATAARVSSHLQNGKMMHRMGSEAVGQTIGSGEK